MEENLKKEKANVEASRGSAEKLKQSLEAAKLAEKDLGINVDLAEARVSQLETQNKLASDNLAKVEAETEERINADRDDLIDLAMYRVWEHNHDIDISFMRCKAEGLLKKWKACLEEEKELRSITASEALSEDDEVGDEASSQSLTLSRTPAMIAAEIRSIDEKAATKAEAAATSAKPQIAEDAPDTQP